MTAEVSGFFDEGTNTISYVVRDPGSRLCAIIDPVLDFDPASGHTGHASADRIRDHIESANLEVRWILETHVHADHLTAAPYLKQALGGQTVIGKDVAITQSVFADFFNVSGEFRADGSQFDRLVAEGDTLAIGDLELRAMATPGHTPACMSYLVDDCLFVGDTLFMPDFGTARTDFPGGDAATLYRSIRKIFALPDDTRLFMCHDYKAPGRDEFRWVTTVGEQRAKNVHVHDGVSESDFVEFREGRDAGLAVPRLLFPSVQVNMRAGEFPPAESNGIAYLKLPLDAIPGKS